MPNKSWKNYKLKDFASYLIKIINQDLTETLDLKSNHSPTKRQLLKEGHIDFVSAYTRYGYKLSEIIKEAGLIQSIETKNWN